MTSARVGILMVVLAGVCWSLQGVTIRFIEDAAPEQIVFWRAVSQTVVFLILLTVFNRGRVLSAFIKAGWVGIAGGACLTVASMGFVFAIHHTTVANVVFMLAASPFFASLFAWVLLGERVPGRSLVAMGTALIGIGVIGLDGDFNANLTGNLLALATSLGFAGMAVAARWGKGLSMLPAPCWSAMAASVIAWGLCGGDVVVPTADIGYAVLSGGVITCCGATLFLIGSRHVPAGILAFLTMTETVLAPIWVWIGFNEVPGALTLAGGCIVLGAIVVEGAVRLFKENSQADQRASNDLEQQIPVRRSSSIALPVASIATGLILMAFSGAMILSRGG